MGGSMLNPAQTVEGDNHLYLLADDPISSSREDIFNREAFAQRIAELVSHIRTQTPTSVLALIGPWGSGKSSLLNLVRERVNGFTEWEVVEFNPWVLSDLESIIRNFFGTLISAIPKDTQQEQLRKKLARYATSVSPYAGILQVPGIQLDKALEQLAALLAGDESLANQRKQVEEALTSFAKPILITIDDIDRLQPDELVLLFKLVRLVGRLPNVYYLLAFDERTVLDVLMESPIARNKELRALSYLEKIVQVRLDLPPLHEQSASNLVERALERTLTANSLTLSEDDIHRFALLYQRHVYSDLTEPRHIKRMFGQVEALLSLVASEVNTVDFVLLTYLRTIYPQLYKRLYAEKDQLVPTVRGAVGKTKTPGERLSYWRKALESCGVEDNKRDGVLEVLGDLFLPIKGAVENTEYGKDFYSMYAEQKRVGSADYFDRYFQFGVPPDDISDGVIIAALDEIAEGRDGPQIETVRRGLEAASGRIVSKLVQYSSELSQTAQVRLLKFIASIYKGLPEGSLFTDRPKLRAIFFGAELLMTGDSDNPAEDVNEIIRSEGGLAFLVRAVDHALKRLARQEEQPSPWLQQIQGEAAIKFRAALDDAVTHPISEHAELFHLLGEWAALESREAVRAWLIEQLEAGELDARSLAGCFVTTATRFGAGAPKERLNTFSWQLEDILSMNDFLAYLGDLHDVPATEPQDFDEEDMSLENRMKRALIALRGLKEVGETRAPK
jgi:predicted KAP-like P-loop ATPase